MNKTEITIVITFKNGVEGLSQTIESIEKQKHCNYKVIIAGENIKSVQALIQIPKENYKLLECKDVYKRQILLFAGIRFMLAGVMVLVLQMVLTKRCIQFKKGSGKRIAVLALFQTIGQYFFFYVGLAHTSGVKGAIITGMNVFLAILVSSFIFHFEKLNKRKMIGCCLGFAGIVIINVSPSTQLDASFSIMGEGFV